MTKARCTVCVHEQCQEINRRLVGSSPPNYSAMARAFGLDHEAIARHHRTHLPALLVKAGNLAEITSAEWIVRTITAGLSELDGVVARCRTKGDERTIVAAVKAKASLVNTVVGAAAVILEGERTRAAKPPDVTLAQVETEIRRRIDREIGLRSAGSAGGPPGAPADQSTDRLGVSAPGYLDLPGNPPGEQANPAA